MLPMLLVVMHFGLLKFKGELSLTGIVLPVHHSWNFDDLMDYDVAVINADSKGTVSLAADYIPVQQSPFIFPSSFFSLYDSNINRIRTQLLQQSITDVRCVRPRTRFILAADGCLPYFYFKQLLSCVCGLRHNTDECRMYCVVDWQGHFQKTITRTAN